MPVAVKTAIGGFGTVTICYFGTTVTVPEKIAERLLKVGAQCGPCGASVDVSTGPFLGAFPRGANCGLDKDKLFPLLLPFSNEKAVQINGASK